MLFRRSAPAADDLGQFLRNWIQNPRAVGAVAPSGRSLARLMATGVTPGARVVELGGGTGTVTQAIVDSGVKPQDLVIVEQNPQFCAILRRRFPSCIIVEDDVAALAEHLDGERGTFDYVISGLPLVLFSSAQKLRLVTAVFDLLAPHGVLHQFTYAGRCPINRDIRDGLSLQCALLGIAPINLPPAFVYRLARR
jgi:phosphatidylethanolamine/phosphatidyl-N-methylethanolamine N-methyltransferase